MKEKKARNELIRKLYKPGMGGVIGRSWGIKRQRVHQIIHKKPQDGFWRALWHRLNKLM